MFLQLAYVSTARAGLPASEIPAILEASRRNNARDEITGLLYSDGTRFLQVLEGPEDGVTATLARIKADPRHIAVVLLSRRVIERREFGDWSMAHYLPGVDADRFVARIGELVASASPNIRATFEGFAKVRIAA